MNHASYRAAGIVLLTLGAALPAHAQDERKAEISAGYQLLTFHEEDVDVDLTMGKGWYADVAGNIGSLFAVVFQASGNYKTFDQDEMFEEFRAVVDGSLHVHNYFGGVRVGPRHTTISPYGEFLVGGVTGSATVTSSVTGAGRTIFSDSSSESSTEFALQFGGGVTIWLNKRIGVRGAVGYLRVMGDGDDGNIIRVAGGVSFGF